jgi:hypothetical protein
MDKYRTKPIIVTYDRPVEKLLGLEVAIPRVYEIGRRTVDVFNHNCGAVYKESTPYFGISKELYYLELDKKINSKNIPKIKSGVTEFQVTLFERERFDDRNDIVFMNDIEADGYEVADVWQLISFFRKYPSFQYYGGISANADYPVVLSAQCTVRWMQTRTGLFLEPRDCSVETRYIRLVLAVKKPELNYEI